MAWNDDWLDIEYEAPEPDESPEPEPEPEPCAACERTAICSDAPEAGVEFYEPVCEPCRANAIRDSQMTDFDRAYERAIANGRAD
jgi:hypothetical protein